MYRRCNYCVMDNTAEEITFDDNGRCNFCLQAEKSFKEVGGDIPNIPIPKGKKYDVLIGLSGGVDSSTVLHYAVKWGLRPFCFSVDNGWNDPKADENIMRMVEKLNVPFYRYTIDLPKFKELQSSFIKAGQKNIEIPTDHVLLATTYEVAVKHGIKTILSGGNTATESIMPPSWGYNARDARHVRGVYKWATGKKLKGLPVLGLLKWNWYKWVKGIKIIYPLDYLDYNREKSIQLLKDEYGYRDYGEKHSESIFTRWFQNYYLFEKFGIDKRKAHLSSLIVSGQMTREEALKELDQSPIYPQLGIEKMVMKYPRRHYTEFPTDERLFNFISKVIKKCRF